MLSINWHWWWWLFNIVNKKKRHDHKVKSISQIVYRVFILLDYKMIRKIKQCVSGRKGKEHKGRYEVEVKMHAMVCRKGKSHMLHNLNFLLASGLSILCIFLLLLITHHLTFQPLDPVRRSYRNHLKWKVNFVYISSLLNM